MLALFYQSVKYLASSFEQKKKKPCYNLKQVGETFQEPENILNVPSNSCKVLLVYIFMVI